MDIFTSILEAVQRTLSRIPYDWVLKAGMGVVFLSLQRHFMIFTAFTILVCLDLVAKFIALSYHYLQTQGMEKPSLVESIHGIPSAHRAGVINSWEMKTQFLGKIIVYMLLVSAGACIDFVLAQLMERTGFVTLVIAYLASTELLSIVENLDDAGVSAVHELAALIKRRRG